MNRYSLSQIPPGLSPESARTIQPVSCGLPYRLVFMEATGRPLLVKQNTSPYCNTVIVAGMVASLMLVLSVTFLIQKKIPEKPKKNVLNSASPHSAKFQILALK